MKALLLILMAQLLVFTIPGCCAVSMPEAKGIIKVMDEQGKPVPDADVTLGFQYNKALGAGEGWGNRTITNHVIGKSNADGIFEEKGKTNEGVPVEVSKKGYYVSTLGTKAKLTHNPILNRWEPWPLHVEIVLKKMRNPVAMYQKTHRWGKVPVFDKPVGYDLEAGDWVSPYGKGKIPDFVFTMKSTYESNNKFEVSYDLTFSNPLDGIQEYEHPKDDPSWYEWPFEAPENGYQSQISRFYSAKTGTGRFDYTKYATNNKDNVRYIFCVRTKTDATGKITSAAYGKLPEDIKCEREGVIYFNYWFNPDGTRNLEEDPKKNLCPGGLDNPATPENVLALF